MPTERTQSVSLATLRRQGLLMGVVLALLLGLILPLLRGKPYAAWPFVAGALVASVALVFPRVWRPFYQLWLMVGHVLGWINTRLILGLVYFILFVPVGLVLKIIGHDPLARSIKKRAETYRVSSRPAKPGQMENPY